MTFVDYVVKDCHSVHILPSLLPWSSKLRHFAVPFLVVVLEPKTNHVTRPLPITISSLLVYPDSSSGPKARSAAYSSSHTQKSPHQEILRRYELDPSPDPTPSTRFPSTTDKMRTYDDTFSGARIYPGKVRENRIFPTVRPMPSLIDGWMVRSGGLLCSMAHEEAGCDGWARRLEGGKGYSFIGLRS